MKRLAHGAFLLDDNAAVPRRDAAAAVDDNTLPCPQPSRFDYLFPELQDSPDNRLPEDPAVAQALIDLGNSMTDPEPQGFEPADPAFDSTIPSVYSYFGQFITHEIVLELTMKNRRLGPETVPLVPDEIPTLTNARTALMDLDSVYGPMLDEHGRCYSVPVIEREMEVGSARDSRMPGTDVPREPQFPYTARIGDHRHDANLTTSQMHLAFLSVSNES